MSIEKAMQLIKGGYSYRLKQEHGYSGARFGSEDSQTFELKIVKACSGIVNTSRKILSSAGWWIRPKSFHTALRIWRGGKQQGLKPHPHKIHVSARLKSRPDTKRATRGGRVSSA